MKKDAKNRRGYHTSIDLDPAVVAALRERGGEGGMGATINTILREHFLTTGPTHLAEQKIMEMEADIARIAAERMELDAKELGIRTQINELRSKVGAREALLKERDEETAKVLGEEAAFIKENYGKVTAIYTKARELVRKYPNTDYGDDSDALVHDAQRYVDNGGPVVLGG